MKKLFALFVLLLCISESFAQVPEGFNYQAVARDANGNIRSNEFIDIRFTLQPGVTAPATWIETHSIKTDGFGVFTAIIGDGTKTGGTATAFKDLDFTKGDYWIKVEVKDGANYVQIGNLQSFLSVPYALVSKTTLDKDDADADPTNEIQLLGFSNDTLYLSKGGFVFLGNYDNSQALDALLKKMINDSMHFNQLIDQNGKFITQVDQNLKALKSKHAVDSAYMLNLLDALNDALATETSERKDEILTITNQILAIQNKHKTDSTLFVQAIQSLNVNLTTESTNRVAADNTIKAKATTDSTLFKSLYDNLSAGLTTETTNRSNADNVLRSKQGADSTYFEGKIKNVETTLNTETTNRINADNALKTKAASDSTYLNGLISTHVSRDNDTSSANELQTISISNDTISLSKSGSIKLPVLGWSMVGNSATVDGTNFIGTTDNIPFNIRVNNQKAGRIDPAGATFFGYQAGNKNTNISNTGFGYQALYSNTSGSLNTAVGWGSLNANNTGHNNTAFGFQALYANTTGTHNTAYGSTALLLNTTGIHNTALGMQALNANTTGSYNTATGLNALYFNTTGSYNTATGYFALQNNTTASQNTAIGNYALNTQSFSNSGTPWNSNNVAVGHQALYSNQPTATTNGYENTAIGNFALSSNTIGYWNTSIGKSSLYSNTTGFANTATGRQALYSNTTGVENTATGENALTHNISGSRNTAVGLNTLYYNTTGDSNTAIGASALFTNTTGFNNTANGVNALLFNSTGYFNTATGTNALHSNSKGHSNTAYGVNSLYKNDTGNYNVALGANSLYTNTSGVNNIAVGYNSLVFNTNGYSNTAVGHQSLFYNSIGYINVAIGQDALYNNTKGYANVAVGNTSLVYNTEGYYNTAIGHQSLFYNSTGYYNTAIGQSALISNSTGYYNTAIGQSANVGSGDLTNATAIGYNTVATASNQVRLGNSNVTSLYCQGAYAATTTQPANLYVDANGQIVRSTTSSHYIGELYGGGIVVAVWTESGVQHGLIASVTDLSAGTAWSNITAVEIGTSARSTTDGLSNTNAIITQSGHTSSAAKLCNDYSFNGYNDWYLPASWELQECYNAAFIINTVLGSSNGFQHYHYWSSTEYDNRVWHLDFTGMDANLVTKDKPYKVRAVRRF